MFIRKFRDLFYYQAVTEIEIVTLKVEQFYLKLSHEIDMIWLQKLKKAYFSFIL